MVPSTRAALLFLFLSSPTHCIAMSAKRKGKAGKGYDCESDDISKMIMFGDSLVDVGMLNNPAFGVCQLADKLCINVTAALDSPIASGGTGNNFAVSGAKSTSAGGGNVFEAQVTGDDFGYLTFLAAAQNTTTPVVPPETLVFIWFGGNDVGDALAALATSEDAAGAVITAAIAAIRRSIVSLIDASACNFLVLGTFNVALAPYVRLTAQDVGTGLSLNVTEVVGAVEQLSLSFNTQLEAMLQGINITDSEGCYGIKYVDTIPLLEDVILSDKFESKFGVYDPNSNVTDLVCNFRYYDNVTDSQLDPNNLLPVLSEDEIDFDCENFPFYDEIHPSTDFFELFADSFLDEVEDFVKGETRFLRRGL
mmetsp:Transcript_624/g.1074  ORF Transcript_624/g.1074 Transcript_624/m.1074 type:complete len:365 (+) Transcript_624:130-1224(+)|eukprot:CAMPEP_0196143060 /NCGR_PEP_ID=MMETSP0910-20130528/12596_1 /TAXON_ID=49265 /ORGANISM="Thalassiosira rotula, Strain GSO102" /LENGTH=364 /DNA_ID=CAMNT_0041404453 /DNA_START=95 /DNA_END=1189 /DNA_ORIENTATION=-